VEQNEGLVAHKVRLPEPNSGHNDDCRPKKTREYAREIGADTHGIGHWRPPWQRRRRHSSDQEVRQAPPTRILHPVHHIRRSAINPQVCHPRKLASHRETYAQLANTGQDLHLNRELHYQAQLPPRPPQRRRCPRIRYPQEPETRQGGQAY
jgi:hypothetical protein